MDKSRFTARNGRTLWRVTTLGALAAAVLLALAGCASPGDVRPRDERLPPAAVGLEGGAQAPAVADLWWQSLQDPALDALVERALAGHPSLKAAQARLQRAAAGVAETGAFSAPQVALDFEATRQRYSENGLVPPPLGGSIQTNGTLQLGMSWELDFFGRNRAALDAAVGTQRASEADAQAARVLLATQVARQYLQLARLHELRDVAQRSLAQRTEVLALIRQRVQAGIDTQVELRQGEGALPETRQQIEALDEQIALARHALAALTVQPPNALDALAPRLQAVQALPLPPSVPADLLGRRADVEAARWRVEAATQGLAVARADFYPSVNLIAFAGFTTLGLDRLLDAGSRQYGIGPALHLPIFDAGRLRARYQGQAADVDLAVDAYNAAVLDAVRDVADQISSVQSIDRQQREQDAALTEAQAAYDFALQRFRAGLGTYLTVLTAESNVLAQRRSAAELKARALDTQIALVRALGGGYIAADAPRIALAH
jgi:NodT family efflux transporter outer membrane factor (OMF) lipoprotein